MYLSLSIYAIKISVLTLLISSCQDTSRCKDLEIPSNTNVIEFVDYDKNGLRVRTINLDLRNYKIQITRKKEKLELDLNKLNIPWKTPEVSWVNKDFICIDTWWSLSFARSVFIPLNGKLNKYIFIDKDIEGSDSATNQVVYVDTVINEKELVLCTENLLNRKKKTIQIPITSANALYPYYDSLRIYSQGVKVWVGKKCFYF